MILLELVLINDALRHTERLAMAAAFDNDTFLLAYDELLEQDSLSQSYSWDSLLEDYYSENGHLPPELATFKKADIENIIANGYPIMRETEFQVRVIASDVSLW